MTHSRKILFREDILALLERYIFSEISFIFCDSTEMYNRAEESEPQEAASAIICKPVHLHFPPSLLITYSFVSLKRKNIIGHSQLNIYTDFNDKMQNRLEVTSRPNCTLRKNDLKSLQSQIVHDANRLEVTSSTFCTRRKTFLQTFKDQLFLVQNRHANVQEPIVPYVKHPCKCSVPYCS